MKKKPTRTERFARSAEDEIPYAVNSGLTTSLIAGAQPQNALADRRIYQPPLASMEAQNPDPRLGRMGLGNALSDLYAEPGRMLPGSGGWTEGMGATAPHLAAATFDPAGAMLGGLAGRAAAPVVRGAMKQAPAMKNAMSRLSREEHGTFGFNQPIDDDHIKWLEQEQFTMIPRHEQMKAETKKAQDIMQTAYKYGPEFNKQAWANFNKALDTEQRYGSQINRIRREMDRAIRQRNRQSGYRPSDKLRDNINDIGDGQ